MGAPSVAPERKKPTTLIITLSIVLILVIAGLYVFAGRSGSDTIPSDDILSSSEVQPITNTSDDLDSIEADLNASIEGLDMQGL